jgi:hypothetical protein
MLEPTTPSVYSMSDELDSLATRILQNRPAIPPIQPRLDTISTVDMQAMRRESEPRGERPTHWKI